MSPKHSRKNAVHGSKKPRRSILTLEKKVEILEMIKAGTSITALGQMYGVKESTIRAIKQYGESMRAAFASGDEIDVNTLKLKRTSLTLARKMEILERLKAGESATALGRVYGVNESTIRTIKKYEDSVRASFAATGGASANMCRMPCHSHAHDAMEKMLYDWLMECSYSGTVLSPGEIREKAAEIYKMVDGVDSAGKNKFVASVGWFRNFKQRFNLQDLKILIDDDFSVGPDTFEDSHDWALLEAGNISHPAETSQEADDSSLLIGGQLPIKLPRKQETLTSKEEYFAGSSSSDAGPGYDPPVQHDDDSHATFVDYVFQSQKEIGALKGASSTRTDTLEHSSNRLENEPKPGTSNEDPSSAVTIVCAPDLTAVKSPQRVETTDDPLVITMAPPQPPRLKNVSFTPIRKNISKSVTITPKPAGSSSSSSSSSSTSCSPRVSVVYFGDDPDQQSNSNIEKVLMQLRAEKLLLEMDKLKAERDKMGVEVRNIMLRRKILTLRKQLFECGEDTVISSDTACQHMFKQASESNMEAASGKSLPNIAVEHEQQIQEGIGIRIERTLQNSADTHKQSNTGKQKELIMHKPCNKVTSNTGRVSSLIQNKNGESIKKSDHQNVSKSQKKKIESERSDSASTSCFPRLVGNGEEIRVKVEAEDPDKLEKVGIFYETSGEGLDIDRRISVGDFSECGALAETSSSLNTSSFGETCNALSETCSNPSILETRLLSASDRHWDPSESRSGGGVSEMDSSSYGNLAFKRLGEFEDRVGLHRAISEQSEDDVIAKRRRIEDEFGLRHMDMT